MRQGIVASLAAATLGVLGMAGMASAESSHDSKIVIKRSPAFHGSVDSNSRQCIEGRLVKLLRFSNDGSSEVIAKDRTNEEGHWSIIRKDPRPGTYRAKVKRTQNTSGVFCGGDRSNRLNIG